MFRAINRSTPLPQDLLRPDGIIDLRTSHGLDAIEPVSLRLWCHVYARYGLVTTELIAWLREQIGARKAIEIGSGHGDLAHHLGILGTDNKCQTWPDVKAIYTAVRQPVIDYPAWIEEIDALEAVTKHQPDVVIGSWVTRWIDPNEPPPPGGGSVYGIREDEILATGVTYIMIGNLGEHGHKPILQRPHEEHSLPFLRSRASRPDLDRVFIWRGA